LVRINAAEHWAKENLGADEGLTLDDSIEIAKILEANGADAFHISTWGYGPYFIEIVFPHKAGERIPAVAAIKKNVSVPVFVYGRLTPELAESALRQGKADFAAFGRQLLADPYFPQKLAAGEISEIVPCINCHKCGPVSATGFPIVPGIGCSINARCGREAEFAYPITKAQKPKKVVVVGGGPGGMEAARVAALRGHSVTLYEKSKKLGGQSLICDKAEGKEHMALLPEYLKARIKKASVTVKLGTEVTKETVLGQQPDAVIVATGPQPIVPKIKGLEKMKTVSAVDAVTGNVKVGKRVIVIGGGMVGLEAAEILGARGKKTTIVEILPEVGTKIAPPDLGWIMKVLADHDVQIYVSVTSQEVTDQGMVIIDKDGKKQLLEADTIILAAGAEPNNKLFLELQGKVPELYCIGDAQEPRWIIDAIYEGFKAAYSL
jgi:thioredoxin reductase